MQFTFGDKGEVYLLDKSVLPMTMKASFWGLFRTNFCGHFCKLFLFTKFNFSKFREKVSLTVLRSMCLEFYASNYFT